MTTTSSSAGPADRTILRPGAAGQCQALLTAGLDRDWSRKLPRLDWTVAHAVTHVAEGTLWYATDLAAGPGRLDTLGPSNTDPWEALLWANGRIGLPGHQRQVDWRWHCAPLEEWDGLNPAACR